MVDLRLTALACAISWAGPLTEKGIIRWGYRLESVDATGTLHFTSGDKAGGFDLIVGADGAWSKVRKVLTDEMPSYAGVGGFEGKIFNAAHERPWIDRLTNKGSWMSLGDCKSLGTQQCGDGTISAVFWHAGPEDWTKDYDLDDPTAIKEALHREYRDWSAEYHAVIDAVDPASFQPRSIYHLPTGMTWESKPGFTIIGDAAHLMSPFSGEGVNCGMLDACELAAAIRKAATTGAQASEGLALYVAEFEKTMRARTSRIQHSSYLNLQDMYLNPDALRANIEKFMIRNLVEELGWYARIPATILVYTYFFYVKWRLG